MPIGASAPEFNAALERVVRSLDTDANGRPRGAVFAQPVVDSLDAGVAFFDGFHFERSSARGSNEGVTSGAERGDVTRGDLERGDEWSEWLASIARVFPEIDCLDIEWARDERGYVLLQVRRAAFALRRNPLLSVANHREILGEAPTPWIVSALDIAGREAFSWFARADARVAGWNERYCRVAFGRAWMDFSAFFRLMDHWGLPRTFVTEGVGGGATGPHGSRLYLGRFLRSSWRLVRLQLDNLWLIARMHRELDRVRAAASSARDLPALHAAFATGLAAALKVNFALGGALAGVQRLRRAVGIRTPASVVTGEMGRSYEALRRAPAAERDRILETWLERFGHRGPLESDPIHPRFAEMREALAVDLARGTPDEEVREQRAGAGPLFWLERRRELFRDELMKIWFELRRRLVAEGTRLANEGLLDHEDDVFYLASSDLESGTDLTGAARRARASWEATRFLHLPRTARLDEIVEAAESALQPAVRDEDGWRGIGLNDARVEGVVRRAEDLAEWLADPNRELGRDDVLVVPALEPSWGVLFGRVGAVVAELGGELSHASILLREMGTPAVVNCLGIWAGVRDGERVVVDAARGRVERLERPREPGQPTRRLEERSA